MKQPINTTAIIKPKKKKPVKEHKCGYGTSKLEVYFKENFLDKLGIEYEYQKEFPSLKRVWDFYLPKCNILLEVDGTFFHSDPRFYDQNKLSRIQKKNKRSDEAKNRWAAVNGIVLIRIWENDIHKNPEMVMEMLRRRTGAEKEKQTIIEKKKTGEFFHKKINPII